MGRLRGVHTFPMVISPKVNEIARLEIELAYYDVAFQYVNHYVMGTLYAGFINLQDGLIWKSSLSLFKVMKAGVFVLHLTRFFT